MAKYKAALSLLTRDLQNSLDGVLPNSQELQELQDISRSVFLLSNINSLDAKARNVIIPSVRLLEQKGR